MPYRDASERFIQAHSWLCRQFGLELVEVAPDMFVPLSAAEHTGLDLRSHRQWELLDGPLSDAERTPKPLPDLVKLFDVSSFSSKLLQPTATETTSVTVGVGCRPTQLRLIGGRRRQFCVWSVGVNGPGTYALLRCGSQIELVVARDVWLQPGETLWVEYGNASDTPGKFVAEVWGYDLGEEPA